MELSVYRLTDIPSAMAACAAAYPSLADGLTAWAAAPQRLSDRVAAARRHLDDVMALLTEAEQHAAEACRRYFVPLRRVAEDEHHAALQAEGVPSAGEDAEYSFGSYASAAMCEAVCIHSYSGDYFAVDGDALHCSCSRTAAAEIIAAMMQANPDAVVYTRHRDESAFTAFALDAAPIEFAARRLADEARIEPGQRIVGADYVLVRDAAGCCSAYHRVSARLLIEMHRSSAEGHVSEADVAKVWATVTAAAAAAD